MTLTRGDVVRLLLVAAVTVFTAAVLAVGVLP